MHKYVQDVKKRMMAGATKREHFYVKLYVGCRDWDQATVWAKGMVGDLCSSLREISGTYSRITLLRLSRHYSRQRPTSR